MLSAAIARADTPDDPLNALTMGGTGMPTPGIEWQDRIITDYVDPATGTDCAPVTVLTPESQASTSTPAGLAALQAATVAQQATDPGQPYLVEGPIGQDIGNLLVASGSAGPCRPILGLLGPLGALFTS